MAKGQAEIAIVPGRSEGEDEPSPAPASLVSYLRNGEVASAWRRKDTNYLQSMTSLKTRNDEMLRFHL